MAVLLASAAELNLLLGETVVEERAEFLLGLASGLAADTAGPGAADWDAMTVPGSVKPIVLAAAGRAVLNPGGANLELIGDYRVTHTSASAGVYLTADEVTTCRRAVPGGRGPVSVPLANRFGETLHLPTV